MFTINYNSNHSCNELLVRGKSYETAKQTYLLCMVHLLLKTFKSGRIQGEGGGARTIGKNKIFWRKIVIFHTKYP